MDTDPEASADVGTAAAYGDLVTATLFVFILALAAYVLNFQSNQDQSKAIGKEVTDIIRRQSKMVEGVSDKLNLSGIQHVGEKTRGVLRVSAHELAFAPGSYDLPPGEVRKVREIGKALASILPCYGHPSEAVSQLLNCHSGHAGQLRAVAIEGHTDNVPLSPSGKVRNNTDLSALRASTVLKILQENPLLSQIENNTSHQVFFAAGYGDTRPINAHETTVSDKENRRIEFRLVLDNPWTF